MGQRSALLAALVGAVAVSTTSALAVETKPTAKNLLGFDETYVRTLSASDVIPEVRILETFDFNETAVVAEPFVGPGEAAEIEKRFINGADDRYLYSDTNYPYSAIGKLQWSNGVFCSGALVGPRHVLTAKHCIVNGQSGSFSPSFDNGARLGSGAVTTIITSGYEWGTPCGWKGDWAILILDRRLGDERGYFGVKLPERSKVDNPMFHHIGYPGDRDNGNRPYRTNGNTVQGFRAWDCDQYGPFYTDTDCAGGQSGGPHWEVVDGSRYIWGTLSVTFDGGNGVAWSGWGSGEQMLDSVIRARNDFP